MRLLPAHSVRRLCGFGMSQCADGYVFRPMRVEDILAAFELARCAGRKVVLRAAGRSYGDAAIGPECLILDMTWMDQILSLDRDTGLVELQPGATLEQIWRKSLPNGWWLPVVSGTMRTSIGGALAMDIHGKNNFVRGPMGEHVREIDVVFPNGENRTLTPADDLFYAVISGAGLLGVIARVRLQMKKITSGDVRVEACSCANWEEQFAGFERYEGKTEYVVSWIDCFGRGEGAGRGILHAGRHLEDAPGSGTLQLEHQSLPPKIMGLVPKSSVWRFLKPLNNRTGMHFVNWAKYMAGKYREHGHSVTQSLAAYNFLLDYVPGWEKAYLPGGLIQCQYFVPKENARSVFAKLVELQQTEQLESFLAVMKRHRPDKFLLSHAVDGYSLALDFKVTEENRTRLWDLARRMNDHALSMGGRFYFAKDSTLTAQQAHAFLGSALTKFREYKKQCDPEGLLTSSLAERLELA